jgi:hypothetical protein
MQQQYLDRREAADYLTHRGLRTSWRTLQKMATLGGGPQYRRFGGYRVVYTAADLDAYIERRLSAPRCTTSEAA